MVRYKIQTYGCQMNEHDSEILAGQLEQLGYSEAPVLEEADLILLNTCTVRETAAQKALGELGRLKTLKVLHPDLMIGVCGCMAQEEERVNGIKRAYPYVDLVFGTHNLHRLPELVERARQEEAMVVDVWQAAGEVVEDLPMKRAEGVKAWVTVIHGCDKHCTYCIVPFTRGRERSRQPADVIAEVEALGRQGFREVTLLGQNVNSYGKDLAQGYVFADLLADLDKVEGIRWIRYMTSHPRDFSRRLVDVIADAGKICEHFHLPVQAGSDEVLRRMNRRYTREQYLDLIRYVRDRVPAASITTDIIVGFPGETDEDFRHTLEMVEEAEFDNAFMFVYSPRAGTPAARWQDPVPLPEKKERLQRLMDLQYAISLKKNQAMVGRRYEVLVDGPSKKDPGVWSGRTRGNKLVLIPAEPGGDDLTGSFAQVEVTEARTWTLDGKLVGRPVPAGTVVP